MKDFSFGNVAIGLSAVVDVFDQDDLFEEIDNSNVQALSQLGGRAGFKDTRAIRKSTGVSVRRLLRVGVRPVDMAVRLCRRLQDVSETQLSEFTHVLLCHSHTDPSACQRLAMQLAYEFHVPANNITAFNHGCAGFLKLVADGRMLLEQCEEDAKVALISVETPEFWHDASDRLFCGLVSAGATAAVLEFGRGLPLETISSDDIRVPSARRPNPDPLFRKEAADVFDFRGQPCRRTVMRMNPEPVFLNGIELMLEHLRSALCSIERAPGERVVVAPHQPSAKLLKALVAAARTEYPDLEFLNNLEFYGNTISSSIPTLVSRLDEVLDRNRLQPLRDGDHLILLGAGICMSEIADHMSAGYVCLRWHHDMLNARRSREAADHVSVAVG